ncbi:MAG: ABC transporter ATP-binding protein [Prevotella sp.]|nr:ABC transporter ATP-binding protein [Prevotella sp.]
MEIRIENLKKSYNANIAVNIEELKIGDGEIVGLVGNNGAGKTTLLRLLLDLIRADYGVVYSNGVNVAKDETWKNYTGSFIDERFLIPFLTPEEFFGIVGEMYNMSYDELHLERYKQMMHDEVLDQKKQIRHFSKGNQQKIGIIAAMMINPKVLILDEPFNYLDPSAQIAVSDMIKQQVRELGTTVILSSHNLSSVIDVSTRVLLMEKGYIIKDKRDISDNTLQELSDYFRKHSDPS